MNSCWQGVKLRLTGINGLLTDGAGGRLQSGYVWA